VSDEIPGRRRRKAAPWMVRSTYNVQTSTFNGSDYHFEDELKQNSILSMCDN